MKTIPHEARRPSRPPHPPPVGSASMSTLPWFNLAARSSRSRARRPPPARSPPRTRRRRAALFLVPARASNVRRARPGTSTGTRPEPAAGARGCVRDLPHRALRHALDERPPRTCRSRSCSSPSLTSHRSLRPSGASVHRRHRAPSSPASAPPRRLVSRAPGPTRPGSRGSPRTPARGPRRPPSRTASGTFDPRGTITRRRRRRRSERLLGGVFSANARVNASAAPATRGVLGDERANHRVAVVALAHLRGHHAVRLGALGGAVLGGNDDVHLDGGDAFGVAYSTRSASARARRASASASNARLMRSRSSTWYSRRSSGPGAAPASASRTPGAGAREREARRRFERDPGDANRRRHIRASPRRRLLGRILRRKILKIPPPPPPPPPRDPPPRKHHQKNCRLPRRLTPLAA